MRKKAFESDETSLFVCRLSGEIRENHYLLWCSGCPEKSFRIANQREINNKIPELFPINGLYYTFCERVIDEKYYNELVLDLAKTFGEAKFSKNKINDDLSAFHHYLDNWVNDRSNQELVETIKEYMI
jgi:hypothetical protein